MPVTGELVEAHIRHDDQVIPDGFPARGYAPLQNAISSPGLRTPGVFARIIGHPEQHDPAQSFLGGRPGDVADLADGVPPDTRH